MPAQTRKQAAQLWKEPPLPGFLQCLTVQVNATYYAGPDRCRWTAIVRDPIDNVEILRLIGPTREDDQAALDSLLGDVALALETVDYQLHGTVDDLKQALAEEPPPPLDPPKPKRSSRARTATS